MSATATSYEIFEETSTGAFPGWEPDLAEQYLEQAGGDPWLALMIACDRLSEHKAGRWVALADTSLA